MKEWFFESTLPGSAEIDKRGFKLKRKVYEGRSTYQKIQIFDTVGYGRLLVLDGIVQLAEKDEFIYHEMLAHLPLFSHPKPERVLIVGGGDGGALREVLKHPVKEVQLVEIDKKVIELSKRYLPFTACSFNDARVKVFIQDGKEFLKGKKSAFDVIIMDSTDPCGPSLGLFSKEFYKDVRRALTGKGILAIQNGCWFEQLQHIKATYKELKELFPFVALYRATIPSFNCEYCFQLASKMNLKISLSTLKKRFKKIKGQLRYYSPEIHLASSKLPFYLQEALKR